MANPTSMINCLNGTETTQPLLLGAGTTFNGQPLPGGGSSVVSTTATTLSLTAALHANKTVVVNSAAAIAVILPAATGTGNTYQLVFGVAATATSSTIATAASAQVMTGVDWAATTATNAVLAYVATATDNKMSVNGTTQGGVKGDRIVLIDIQTSLWSVTMFSAPTGSTATPFSHV